MTTPQLSVELLLHYIIQMLVARHYAVDAAVINYTTMLSPSIHPSIHPAKKEEKSNRGESTPVLFLLIIERTLTIEEAELCVRWSSYPFDVCSKVSLW